MQCSEQCLKINVKASHLLEILSKRNYSSIYEHLQVSKPVHDKHKCYVLDAVNRFQSIGEKKNS